MRVRLRLDVGQVTGLPGRHLDAWLMPADVCRGLFARAAASAELSIVEGTLGESQSAGSRTSCDFPGDLRPIALALDLPVVAVVSCIAGDAESLHLPCLPEGIDAVLLDKLADPADLPRMKRLFGVAAKLPVIGAIEMIPGARAALEKAPRDRLLPDDLIAALAEGFWKHADIETISELAHAGPLPSPRNRLAGMGAIDGGDFGWRMRRMKRSGVISPTRWKPSKPWGPNSSSFRPFATRSFPTELTW